MKRILIALAFVAVTLPLHADFRQIARNLDQRLGSRTWIPFLGLGRFVVRSVHPKGVHDFQLAVFEGRSRGVDPQDLETLLKQGVDKGFAPLVHVRSNRGRETVLVYGRPHAKCIELMILVQDGGDIVLVRVDGDAETIAREFVQPRSVVKLAQR